MSLICNLIGHKWDKQLDDVPEGAIFYRIDCQRSRCDFAIDAVPLVTLKKSNPELWKRVKGKMP